ncbi:type I restriction modification DNA specificity domain protein, partial [Bacteroidales bacterium KA00344]
PFEIPQGWEWCRVSSLFQINPKVVANDNISAAFIPMEAISAGYGSEFRYYEKKWGEIKSGYTTFADNDIAFAKITPCFQNRKSAIFEGLPNGIGAGTTELKVLRTYGDTINRWFVLYFLESPYFIDEATFKGTANQQRIIVGYLENKLFPIPPLSEQERIVGKIRLAMPIIDKYSKSQEHLDKINAELKVCLKKSILQEAIQGKLVPQIVGEGTAQELLEQIKVEKRKLVKEGKLKKSALNDSVIFRGDDNKYYEQVGKSCIDITDEIPFDLPCNWCWCRFSNIVSMTIGKTPARSEQAYWINGKYNWVSISDMVDGGIISTTKEKVSDLAVKEIFSAPISEKGSLLMSFKLSIGKTSILDIDAYHNEAIITIRPIIDKEYAMRNYLFKVLPQIANFGESKDAIKGKTLNSKSLGKLLIPLPPLQEQQRIIVQTNMLSKQLR